MASFRVYTFKPNQLPNDSSQFSSQLERLRYSFSPCEANTWFRTELRYSNSARRLPFDSVAASPFLSSPAPRASPQAETNAKRITCLLDAAPFFKKRWLPPFSRGGAQLPLLPECWSDWLTPSYDTDVTLPGQYITLWTFHHTRRPALGAHYTCAHENVCTREKWHLAPKKPQVIHHGSADHPSNRAVVLNYALLPGPCCLLMWLCIRRMWRSAVIKALRFFDSHPS